MEKTSNSSLIPSTPPASNVFELPAKIERDEFAARFRASFKDIASGPEDQSITRLEEYAWRGYVANR